MPREIITIQIGQAGIQIGNALWELYCMEHGVTAEGVLRHDVDRTNCIESLFYETKDHHQIPRSVFFDFEPTVVDEIRIGAYRDLFNPASILNGMEDAANNYARGFFSLGKRQIEKCMNIIRKMVMHCDHFALFEILNSYSGGTGSGFTSLLLEYCNDEFAKKYRFSTGIFPSTTFSESTVGPYNALLYTHTTFDNLDCGILVDNESLYAKLANLLDFHKPTYSAINRCLSQMLSCIFLSHRYQSPGSQHLDVDELMTNSVPYPRIHFPVLAYSPLVSNLQINHEKTGPESLTRQIFKTDSHFLNCPMQISKYISCCLLYRGSISPKQVYDAIALVKTDYQIQFVDWCPTGFKVGINYQPSMSTPKNVLATNGDTLCMLSGNIGIKKAWCSLRQKYYHLVSKRSFIHWFIGEGLEESDFTEANEDIQVLEKDYEEIGEDTDQQKEDSKINSERNVSESNKSMNKKSFAKEPSNVSKVSSKVSVKSDSNKASNDNYNKPKTSIVKDNRNSSIVSSKHDYENSPIKEQQNHSAIRESLLDFNCKDSYSKLLYEDIVTKLDDKIQFSNKKMYKKLKKLQNKLGHMNKIYQNNETYPMELNYPRSNAENDFELVKSTLRKAHLSKLGFSSAEEIFCEPNANNNLIEDEELNSVFSHQSLLMNRSSEYMSKPSSICSNNSSRVTTEISMNFDRPKH